MLLFVVWSSPVGDYKSVKESNTADDGSDSHVSTNINVHTKKLIVRSYVKEKGNGKWQPR